MKYADEFPTVTPNPKVIQDLRELAAEEGMEISGEKLANISMMEACGFVVDLETGNTINQTSDWQPFVNFWMDMMEGKGRNYNKLAMVMRDIAIRDGAAVSQADDFETWCNLAKYFQHRYFQRIVPLIAIIALLIGLNTAPVNAAPSDATLVYLGTEISNESGDALNTYYVDCVGEVMTVTIQVTFTDGAVSLRTGEYCQSKIFIRGHIKLAEVIAANAAPQPVTLNSIYLPFVSR